MLQQIFILLVVQRLWSYTFTDYDAHETQPTTRRQHINTFLHKLKKTKAVWYRLCGSRFCSFGVRTAKRRDGNAKQSKHNLQLETVKFHYHQKLLMAWIIRHCKSRMNTTAFGAKPKINAPFLFTVYLDFILLIFDFKHGTRTQTTYMSNLQIKNHILLL